MKLTKKVKFIEPFLKGLRLVDLSKVHIIRGYRVGIGLNENQGASIIKHSSKKYSINLRTQVHMENGTTYGYPTVEEFLFNLAHELAHLKEWDHTPKHFKLETKIMLHFSNVLKELNIQDHNISINKIRRLLNESH